jgi:hypothetical protein
MKISFHEFDANRHAIGTSANPAASDRATDLVHNPDLEHVHKPEFPRDKKH